MWSYRPAGLRQPGEKRTASTLQYMLLMEQDYCTRPTAAGQPHGGDFHRPSCGRSLPDRSAYCVSGLDQRPFALHLVPQLRDERSEGELPEIPLAVSSCADRALIAFLVSDH